ncbi:MAG TPA: hypothetical protein VGR47_00070 [Terracidiphilus sp.]|nr:hypothetical protein [Terracidiphilus sp.]
MLEQLGVHSAEAPAAADPLLLSDEDLAGILLLTIDWVRSHAKELPGFKRLGSYFRFSRRAVEAWLGSLEPVLDAERASQLMHVPKSWVYANADEIPGVLRLGHYIRFRPAVLLPFLNGSEVVQ